IDLWLQIPFVSAVRQGYAPHSNIQRCDPRFCRTAEGGHVQWERHSHRLGREFGVVDRGGIAVSDRMGLAESRRENGTPNAARQKRGDGSEMSPPDVLTRG